MKNFKHKLISAVCLSTLALTGCNDDNASNQSTTMTKVSGTAAIGSPISNAQIDLKCNGYSKDAAATTDTQGKWQVNVPTAQLPCATRLTGGKIGTATNTQKLYSITTSIGTNTTTNLTPLADLILAKTVNTSTGSTLDNWFTGTSLTTTLNNVVAQLAANITTVLNQLAAKGYTIPSGTGFNPFSTSFTATTNNSYDQLLEKIGQAIAASSSLTYDQFKANYLTGVSIPVAPTTSPTGGVTCASISKPKAASSDLTQFVGTYQVKIGNASTAIPLTIAANGNISLNSKTATASDVCGPFVQNNGQGLLILAKNTADIQVNVFKDTAGKITTEGPDFTSASGDYFFGEKSNSTAVVDCESSGADDKLGFKNAPADFCSFSKSTSVAITSPDTYTFFNADKSENVKVTVEGTTVKSIAIENNSYAWACGIGTLTTCSGASFSASNNYKQIAFMNTTLDIVNGASKALIVKNGLLIHLATPVTPPVTPPTQVFSLNPAACTLLSTDSDKTLYSQCHENVVQDMNLSLKTLSNAPCNLIKVGNTVSVTVGGNTIRDTYNADSEDLLQIINPTGSLSFLGNSLIVKTYGAVEISLSLNTNGTFKNVIATQTSPFSQFSCLL